MQRETARTLFMGLACDVFLAAAMELYALVSVPEFQWSARYWQMTGLMVAKTALVTFLSSAIRQVRERKE